MVDTEMIAKYCGRQSNHLVGFFKCRNNVILYPTLRDIAVYDSMTVNIVQKHPLVFGALNNSYEDDSTYVHDMGFFMKTSLELQLSPVKITITNLAPLIPNPSTLMPSYTLTSDIVNQVSLESAAYLDKTITNFQTSITQCKETSLKYVESENELVRAEVDQWNRKLTDTAMMTETVDLLKL
ncbi:hypothetical protein BC833DRAFT_609089 [Globomyces pollinis-pini]|nr:hypothetical protein BC833DRAFT_609089 [Globomyces pollinis-pini]